MIQIALVTGCRKGELLDLEWRDVTLTELIFRDTKNGTTRKVPMTPTLRKLFDSLPRMKAHVFINPKTGKPYQDAKENFRRALKRAGITSGDVRFHTLRHTAITRMIGDGVDDHTVMEIVGHTSLEMLKRYSHPGQERKIAAVEQSANLFHGIGHKIGTKQGMAMGVSLESARIARENPRARSSAG